MKDKMPLNKYYEYLVLFICLLLAQAMHSRAFFIGYLGSLITIVILDKRIYTSYYAKSILVISFIAVLCIITTFIKSKSSEGRILIYKISAQILKHNFWHGIGKGNFGNEYLNYQYNYFKSGHYSRSEFLLADNTKHAFNDYLQYWIENGFVGLIVMISLSILIYFSIKKVMNKESNELQWTRLCCGQVIALSITALFTHVFNHPIFQTIFLISLFTIFAELLTSIPNKWKVISYILISICIYFTNYSQYILNFKNYNRLREADLLYKTGFVSESLTKYSLLYNSLKEDNIFLESYSNALASTLKYEKEQQILVKIIKLDNASIYHLNLAKSYQNTGNFRYAEEEFTKAIYIVPNRFIPRRELLNFYLLTNNKKKALITAKTIISMPIKVKSRIVNRIINDAQKNYCNLILK